MILIFRSPGSRLPPIQQPPRDRNDVVGLPNALPPTIQEEPRPPRRRPLRPSTGSGRPTGNGLRPIRPTPSILDQIPRDDLDNEDISVVEGTFSSPPVVIPVQTGKQKYKILMNFH